MGLRKFLWYILKEDGRSGRVVNDVVSYTGTKTPLPQTGIGWDGLQILWERNMDDHGVIRNATLPFGFVRDAAKIIRDALYNQSIEEKIFLLIQTLTIVFVPGVSYNWLYAYMYKGELDLSAAEDSADMINVPCMEGGLYKLLKANRATKYTFPFDGTSDMVKMDGIALQQLAHYVTGGTISNSIFANTHTIPILFINKEGTSIGTGFFTQAVEDANPRDTYVAASDNYFVINESGASINYNIKGKIYFVCTENTAGLSYRWFLTKQDDTSIDVYNSGSNPVVGEEVEVDIDIDFTLADGEKMFLIGRYFGAGGIDITTEFLDKSSLNLTFESTYKPTYIKCYRKSILYRKLIKEMGIDETLASSQLCLDWDFIVVTSGDAIRGLENPTITTTLNDFFSDMDATFMAGLGIDNGLIEIESRTKYYDNSNPVDLGTIKDMIITPAADIICNKFKHGHVKPDIEDINGKYDPNGSSDFTGPFTKIVKDYSQISPYKAGPYEIESLRLNLDGKISTDDNRDPSCYVINCTPAERIQTNVLLSFISSGNYIVFQDAPVVAVGTKFIVTGTASNDGTYEVTAVIYETTTQTVYTDITITTVEIAVLATVEFMTGQVFLLNRPVYDTLDGVPTDSIFNLPQLTPKTMLLAHGRWIKSMHKGLEMLKLKFNSGDKNTELLTELAGVTIDEDADVLISSLGAVMFIPFYATFATETPSDLVDILEATPNRCFKCYDPIKDIEIEGFLISAGMAPNDLKEQEFKLLLSPNNDINLLT